MANRKNVDERVVRLQFDNKEFETAVKTTLKSLNELEKQLELRDASKGFDKLSTAVESVKMDSIVDELQNVNDKFSLMGTIGRTVIERLTNDAMSAIAKFKNNGVISQIMSGGKRRSENLAQAKFMMTGMGYSMEKGSELYEAINESVNGTAYGLDQASKAASVLLSSGIMDRMNGVKEQLNGFYGEYTDDGIPIVHDIIYNQNEIKSSVGEFEALGKALQMISDVAAMGNMDYDYVANIIEGVYARGYVLTDDLNRLGNSGLGVRAALAKTMNVAEDELAKMVSKKEVDVEKFAEAMEAAFGGQAARANETYAGSLSNVNAALSRIGEPFWTAWEDSMKNVYNGIRPLINQVNSGLSALQYEVYGENGEIEETNFFTSLSNTLQDFTKDFKDWMRPTETYMDTLSGILEEAEYRGEVALEDIENLEQYFPEVLYTLAKKLGVSTDQIKEKLEEGEISLEIFRDALRTSSDMNIKNILGGDLSEAVSMTDLKILDKYFPDVLGRIAEANTLEGETAEEAYERIGKLIESGRISKKAIQDEMTRLGMTDALKDTAHELTDIGEAFTAFGRGLANIGQGLVQRLQIIFDVIRDKVFDGDAASGIRNVGEAFEELTSHFLLDENDMANRYDMISRIFSVIQGGAKIIGIILSPIKALAKVLFGLLGGAFSNLEHGFLILANIGEFIFAPFGKLIENIRDNLILIGEGFDYLFDSIKGNDVIVGKFEAVFDKISGILVWFRQTLFGAFSNNGTSFGQFIKEQLQRLGDFFAGIGKNTDAKKSFSILELLLSPLYLVAQALEKITGLDITGYFAKFSETIGGAWAKVKTFFAGNEEESSFGEKIKEFFSNIKDSFKDLPSIKENFPVLGEILDKIKGFFEKLKNDIKEGGVFTLVKDFFTGFVDILEFLLSKVKPLMGGLIDQFKRFFGFLFGDLTFDQGLAAIDSASTLIFVNSLRDMSAAWRGHRLGPISQALATLRDQFTLWQKEIIPATIQNITIAIVAFTACIVVLSTLDTGKALVGIAAMGILLAMVRSILKTMTATLTGTDVGQILPMAEGLMGLSTIMKWMSLLVLAAGVAIAQASKIGDWKSIIAASIGIDIIIKTISNTISILNANLSTDAMQEINKLLPIIKTFGILVLEIGLAMRLATSALDENNWYVPLIVAGSISAIILALSVLYKAQSGLANGNNSRLEVSMNGVASAVIAIGIACILITKAIANMADIVNTNSVDTVIMSVLSILSIITTLALAAYATQGVKAGSFFAFIGIATALHMVLLAVAALTVAMNSKYFDANNFKTVSFEIIKILLALGAAVGLSSIGTFGGSAGAALQMITMIGLFTSVVAGVLTLLLVTKAADINSDEVANVMNALTMAILAIGAVLAIINGITAYMVTNSGGIDFYDVALEIAAIAIGISVIINAISKIDEKTDITKGLITVGVIAAIMVGVVAALTAIGKFLGGGGVSFKMIGDAILKIGVGMVTGAAGILLLSFAIITLSAALGTGATIIVGNIGIIGVALGLLGEVLGYALGNLAVAAAKSLERGWRQIMKSLVNMTNDLLVFIGWVGDPLAQAVSQLIIGVLYGLDTYMPELIDSALYTVEMILYSLADGIRNNGAGIITGCVNVVAAILDAIGKAILKIPHLTDLLSQIGIDTSVLFDTSGFFKPVEDVLQEGEERIAAFKEKVANSDLMSGVKDKVDEYFGGATKSVDNGGSKLTGIIDTIGKNVVGQLNLTQEDVSGILKKIGINPEEVINEESWKNFNATGSLSAFTSNLGESFNGTIGDLDLSEYGVEDSMKSTLFSGLGDYAVDIGEDGANTFVDTFSDGVQSEQAIMSVSDATDSVLSDLDGYLSTEDKAEQIRDIGEKKITKVLAEGIVRGQHYVDNALNQVVSGSPFSDETLQNVQDNAQAAVENYQNGMSGLSITTPNWDEDFHESFSDRLFKESKTLSDDSTASVLKTATNNLISHVVPSYGFVSSMFRTVGQYIPDGLAKGISDNNKNVTTSMNSISANTVNTYNKNMKIKSPSKVMFESGRNVILGLAAGFNDEEGYLYSEIERISNETVDRMMDIFYTIQDRIDDEVEIVLQPVIDESELEAALDRLKNKYANPQAVQMAIENAEAATDANAPDEGMSTVDMRLSDLNKTNAMINDTINTLKGEFNQMVQAVSSMKVQMDSGELVGAIVAPMSDSLYDLELREGRA